MANITADRQYHSSIDEYHKSVRIYLVVANPYGKSDKVLSFLFIKLSQALKEWLKLSVLKL